MESAVHPFDVAGSGGERVRGEVRVPTGREGPVPIVVLLHGFPFDHTLWDGELAALEPGFRTIAYDARAHGRSGGAGVPFAFEDFVDDLLGVLDGLKVDRAIVVGLSMGGYAALRFAEREPARVRCRGGR